MRKFPPVRLSALLCALLLSGQALLADPPLRPGATREAFLQARERLQHEEAALNPATLLKLSPEEQVADRLLQELKRAEIQRTKGNFPPARNFLLAKGTIDGSPLMPIFRRMPKGAILHVHPGAIQDFRWLIRTATYRPDCYRYQGPDSATEVQGRLAFFATAPGGDWRPVQALRAAAADPGQFDDELYKSLTVGPEDLAGDIWLAFEKRWSRIAAFQSDHRIYEELGRAELATVAAENVQLLELRAFLGGPGADDGSSGGADQAVRRYQAWQRELQASHPEFQLRLIYSRERVASNLALSGYLKQAVALRQAYPGYVMGFDLVNEEDRSHTLLEFLDELLAADAAALKAGVTLPYFFHAGESNWTANENTLDAILLGSRRIGHGLALLKHPRLLQLVKERGIAIEVCPVSNQVLDYVADLRNHPAVNWLRSGIPVVLSPDDPSMMQAGFAYDFYEAFMAWDLDLRDLKRLILNSIEYSTLEGRDRAELLTAWEAKWAAFIHGLATRPGTPAGQTMP